MYPVKKRRFLQALGGASALLCQGAWAYTGAVCEPGLFRRWRFHAGAPLCGPAAISASGRVAVASVEGYLHGLAPDGAFLWSYTVDGSLGSGVHLAGKERFVAATSTSRIYLLASDGRPFWVFGAPATPESVCVDVDKGVLFFTKAKGLYAVSNRAGVLWSLNLGALPVSELSVDRQGRAWVVTADSLLHRVRTPYFHKSVSLVGEFPETANPRIVGFCDGGTLVLGARELLCVDLADGVRWRCPKVDAAAAVSGKREVAVVGDGHVAWLDAASGERVGQAQASIAGPPTWTGLAAHGDWVFCTSNDGRLAVSTRHGKSRHCRLSYAALWSPTVDARRRQVVVSAGDGEVSAVSWSEWT